MKLFGKWDPAEVEVADPSVKGYMNLASKSVIHSGGKHAKQQFKKSEQHIVERLVNKMMRKEKNTGKKLKTYGIVERAFDIVAKKTKENPLSVLVKAIANAGPREEVVRLKYGGITVPKAVDTSPQRRVDTALMFLSQGRTCMPPLRRPRRLRRRWQTRSYPQPTVMSRATPSTTGTVWSAWQKRRDKTDFREKDRRERKRAYFSLFLVFLVSMS